MTQDDQAYTWARICTQDCLVGDEKGVHRCRNIDQMPDGQRWDATLASKIGGKPWDLKAASQGGAQEEAERQETDAPAYPERPAKVRQFKLERWMFESHGWSSNCPACNAKRRNP